MSNRRVEPSRENPRSRQTREEQSTGPKTRSHRLADMSQRRKARIERQEALVARLSDSNKHLPLANEAREILGTLEHTLRLARDHLALELRK